MTKISLHAHEEHPVDAAQHSHAHGHGHGHEHHAHHHGHAHHHHNADRRALRLALLITLGFTGLEFFGAWWSGSLALLSDAGHMLTDSFALGLALAVARLAHRPASARHSYGMGRAEVVGAFVNSLLMIALTIYIAVEAVSRMLAPQPVNGDGVMAIAVLGLAANLAAAWVLSQGGDSLNSRAALLHVIGDLLGSVAAIAAGAVIRFTGWLPIDPLLSVLVAGLIVASAWRLLRESLLVLMEGVPAELDYQRVGQYLAGVAGVASVHDLHIWHMSGERVALSAHLVVTEPAHWPAVLFECQRMLAHEFEITHVTLQPEWPLAPPAGRQLNIEIRASENLE